ncbi:Cytochrome c biogenesis protein ccs1 [Gloeomargarita lithophora Alchichica-D10]|uniref:Cytochrome c biogenesis protein CcsB n=1 Tax=Gloeomargarita lithophora Alchichica-D10 TaxID=1188229 RepID=A0A1J0AGM4_9CYAN|nr:cytochrome c biogenesis protein [Gloeomargarita lithophora]APB35086.1 Cytochrome c biogenesis protein ccs1 [Gloeomargarita lithophora Alchichica-D10]
MTLVFAWCQTQWRTVSLWGRSLVQVVADLRLAIVLLLVIAVASIAGTVIEQGESLASYQENYPEHPALFGFLTWKLILILGLDHVYQTWWYLSLLILFGASLMACTSLRQWPALKVARKWHYYQRPEQILRLNLSQVCDHKPLGEVALILQKKGYWVATENAKLYARKGLAGKIGPIVVHASLVVILLGGLVGALTGFLAQELVPSGQDFQLKKVIEAGAWVRRLPPVRGRVHRFWIDYTPGGEVDQFYTDLGLLNATGEEITRKTIHVNEPLRWRGLTFYQTSWGIDGLRLRFNNSPILELPVKPFTAGNGRKLWGTWLPLKPDLSVGVSLVIPDLQGLFLLYDQQGKLLTTGRVGTALHIENIDLTLTELIGSTGLQIKSDPGVPMVYLGFAGLMLGVTMSYFSHSQVWGLRVDNQLYLGGKTNRAQVTFEREFLEILHQLEIQSQGSEL